MVHRGELGPGACPLHGLLLFDRHDRSPCRGMLQLVRIKSGAGSQRGVSFADYNGAVAGCGRGIEHAGMYVEDAVRVVGHWRPAEVEGRRQCGVSSASGSQQTRMSAACRADDGRP